MGEKPRKMPAKETEDKEPEKLAPERAASWTLRRV